MTKNSLHKETILHYEVDVLHEIFRTGKIIESKIEESKKMFAHEFTAKMGECNAECILMNEKELAMMVSDRLEREALGFCKGVFCFTPVAEVEVKKLDNEPMECYEVYARMRFLDSNRYEKKHREICMDEEKIAEMIEQCAQDIFVDVETPEVFEMDEFQVTVSELSLDYKEILVPGEVQVPDEMVNYPLEIVEHIFKWKLKSLLNKAYPAAINIIEVVIMRDFSYSYSETYEINVWVTQEIMTTVRMEEF